MHAKKKVGRWHRFRYKLGHQYWEWIADDIMVAHDVRVVESTSQGFNHDKPLAMQHCKDNGKCSDEKHKC